MAFEESVESITREAAADLSAKQYFFMSIDSNGRINSTGAGLQADGVLQNDPAALGRAGTLGFDGVSKVVAAAAIAKGALVASDASGKAVTAATGNRVLGIALEAATANNDIIAVNLRLQGGPVAP